MTRLATACLAVLLLSAPMTAFAQQAATEPVVKPEAAAETAPATEALAAEAPAAETAPAATTEAAAEPAPAAEAPAKPEMEVNPAPPAEGPSEVVKESHGDWDIVCSPEGTACVMAQKGADSDGREIMEVRIRRLKETTKNKVTIVAAIQIAVPIGVILPAGVTLQIDTAKPLPAAYRTCNPTACLVQEAVDAGLINAMKKGAQATFAIVAPPNIKVPVEISLTGFTAAYNSLQP